MIAHRGDAGHHARRASGGAGRPRPSVGHGTFWRFRRHKITRKKDGACRRARQAGHPDAGGVVRGPARSRPRTPPVHRRDLDRHGSAPRPRASRPALAGRRAARACVDAPSSTRGIYVQVLHMIGCWHASGDWMRACRVPRARIGVRGSDPHHWNALEALPRLVSRPRLTDIAPLSFDLLTPSAASPAAAHATMVGADRSHPW